MYELEYQEPSVRIDLFDIKETNDNNIPSLGEANEEMNVISAR